MGCNGRAQRNNITKLADMRPVIDRRNTRQTTQKLATKIGLTLVQHIRGPRTRDNDETSEQLTRTTLVLHGKRVPVQDAQQLMERAEILAEVIDDHHRVSVVTLPPLERLARHPHLATIHLSVTTKEFHSLRPSLASLATAGAPEKPVVLRLPRALRLHVLDRGLGVLEALNENTQQSTQTASERMHGTKARLKRQLKRTTT